MSVITKALLKTQAPVIGDHHRGQRVNYITFQLRFSTYLIATCRLVNIAVRRGLLLIRHGTIPHGRSAKLDEPIGLQIVAVKTDLLPFVQRSDGPDYGLRSICHYRQIQLIARLQRSLIRDDAVAVHHRRIQQPHRVRVLLRENKSFRYGRQFVER